jgi:hypothetical protein
MEDKMIQDTEQLRVQVQTLTVGGSADVVQIQETLDSIGKFDFVKDCVDGRGSVAREAEERSGTVDRST